MKAKAKKNHWRSEIRLPIPMAKKLKALAAEGRRPINEQLIMLLERGLEPSRAV